MVKLATIKLLFVFASLSAFGQNDQESKHPIDTRRELCHSIDSNQTTYGMMQCEAIAKKEWDDEMNKYYKLLMDTLASEEKEKLKTAQRQWIEYRDKELEFSWSMFDGMLGTMWRVVGAGRACDIVKERALDLKSYYDMLTFDKE